MVEGEPTAPEPSDKSHHRSELPRVPNHVTKTAVWGFPAFDDVC